MKAIGFCGSSGVGKTTLMAGVMAGLKAAGQRVSVIKHTHKGFDIDRPGKDSFRHREAGAFEVLIANRHRLAKMREFEAEQDLSVHQLLAELSPCDWALVEGFKHADLLKVEVWRSALGQPVLYPHDPFVMAVATDDPSGLPASTHLPVFDLNQPATLAAFLLAHAARHVYPPAQPG